MAVFFILLFTLINCLTLFVSTTIQFALTIVKILSIAVIVFLLFFFTPATAATAPPTHWPGMAPFAAVLMAAFWAYDGWNNLPMLGGEVKNPQHNLPWALAIGILLVLGVYLALNLSFFRVLSFDEVLAANSGSNRLAEPVATIALAKSVPGASVKIIAALLTISALGAMSGSILSSARVPYAMATDRVFLLRWGAFLKRIKPPLQRQQPKEASPRSLRSRVRSINSPIRLFLPRGFFTRSQRRQFLNYGALSAQG